jgi:hypothetical protein
MLASMIALALDGEPGADAPVHGLSVAEFFPHARALRAAFEAAFAEPRSTDRARFVWDYWHVPDQYTYLRTQAKWFFPNEILGGFLAHLRAFGEQRLGCGIVTDPWLSYYVDGCRQELHTDVSQGTWAFVYSLTDWQARRFRGGETMLLDRRVLDYWSGPTSTEPGELATLMHRLPARFNELLVFDPRIPHGVRTVEGTRDPLESRVVLHGWFKAPVPAIGGALARTWGTSVLDALAREWPLLLRDGARLSGSLTLRVRLPDGGGVPDAIELLSNTLVSTERREEAPRAAVRAVLERLGAVRAPAGSGAGTLLVPLRFPIGG